LVKNIRLFIFGKNFFICDIDKSSKIDYNIVGVL